MRAASDDELKKRSRPVRAREKWRTGGDAYCNRKGMTDVARTPVPSEAVPVGALPPN